MAQHEERKSKLFRIDGWGAPILGILTIMMVLMAIATTRAALRPGGVFAVWGEELDAGFAARLSKAGFAVSTERPGRGGRRHAVYIATLG